MRVFIGLIAVAATVTFVFWRGAERPATPQASVITTVPATVMATATPKPAPTATPLAFPSVGQEAILIVHGLGRDTLMAPDPETLARVIDADQRGQMDGSLLFNQPRIPNGSRVLILELAKVGRVPIAHVRLTERPFEGWVVTDWLEQPLIPTR